MNLELSGIVESISDVMEVSATFKKVELILFVQNEKDIKWSDYYKIEFAQAKTDETNKTKVGDTVNISVNVSGRKWEKDGKTNYFTTLQGWKLDVTTAENAVGAPNTADDNGDLPF